MYLKKEFYNATLQELYNPDSWEEFAEIVDPLERYFALEDNHAPADIIMRLVDQSEFPDRNNLPWSPYYRPPCPWPS